MAKREIIIPKGMESLVDKFHYAPAVKVDNILYIGQNISGWQHCSADSRYLRPTERSPLARLPARQSHRPDEVRNRH